MAVTSVTPLYAGQASDSTPQKRTYSGVYQVQVSSASDGQTLVENYYLIPVYGSFFQFGNAVDPLAVLVNKSSARAENTRLMWLVTCRWETQDQEQDKDQKDDDGEPSDNPFDWRDQWEFVGSKMPIPLSFATMRTPGVRVRPVGSGGPPVNAAGVVFDPPAERDFTNGILRITKFRSAFPAAQYRKYKDAINRDTFRIRKPGLDLMMLPFTAKLEPIQGSLQYHQPRDGAEIRYVKLVYEIALNELGWRFQLLNSGYDRRQDEGDKDDNGRTLSASDFPAPGQAGIPKARKAPIKDMDANETRVPILLDLEGQPQRPGDEPIYLEYSGYAELPFAPLRL